MLIWISPLAKSDRRQSARVALFTLCALILLATPHLPAEEPDVQRVDLRICAAQRARCLSIQAGEGKTSHWQNAMSLPQPKVTGLSFDQKQFSSAIIDFGGGTILLRERKKGVYIGEWLISLDSLESHFYAVSK